MTVHYCILILLLQVEEFKKRETRKKAAKEAGEYIAPLMKH